MIEFNKSVVIYLPSYNCEKQIVNTIKGIPESLYNEIECLVVDNNSTDSTKEKVLEAIKSNSFKFPVHLVKANKNEGYAGSQKIAYSIICNSKNVTHVIMLHGDGQYPPHFAKDFFDCSHGNYSVVNGYRSKRTFPEKEETPIITYLIIKSLNILESILTLSWRKEWHSGYVMYRKDFLQKIHLQLLTTSMHFDGEMLMLAKILNAKVKSIPIYKRYKEHEAFNGSARMKYILNVFKVIWQFRIGKHKDLLKNKPNNNFSFTVLH